MENKMEVSHEENEINTEVQYVDSGEIDVIEGQEMVENDGEYAEYGDGDAAMQSDGEEAASGDDFTALEYKADAGDEAAIVESDGKHEDVDSSYEQQDTSEDKAEATEFDDNNEYDAEVGEPYEVESSNNQSFDEPLHENLENDKEVTEYVADNQEAENFKALADHEEVLFESHETEEVAEDYPDTSYNEPNEHDISEESHAAVENQSSNNEVYGDENVQYIGSTSEEILEEGNRVEVVEEVHGSNEEDYDQRDLAQTGVEEEVIDQDNFNEENYEETYYGEDNEKDINEHAEEVEVEEASHTENDIAQEYDVTSQEEIENVDESNELTRPTSPASDENTGDAENAVNQDDDDYEDAVEVEEEKEAEDGEDENVAQHESESDNEMEETAEEADLNDMEDYDVRDSDDDDDSSQVQSKEDEKPSQESTSKMFESESEDEGEKEGDLIADIFGKSDDEDEEFAGFGEDESVSSKKKGFAAAVISDSDEDDIDDVPKQHQAVKDDSSSDEGVRDADKPSGMVYDFDVMMQKKKDERRGRRKRDGGTFISDSDDIINAMLTKMKEAAEGDREANQRKQPALNKLKMLPTVVRHLKKQDLKEAFVDMGAIAAIADWLNLLPDKSLPHITIRSELLGILHDLPPIMPETLKSTGIGRAVMLIFKHPRETRKHKEMAGRLINKWSRPIFGLNDNFKSMSRGEREQRDLEQMPQAKRRRLSSGRNDDKGDEAAAEPGQLRPGERGFVMRARVPKPSNKDYVIRPKWNVEMNDEDSPKSISKRSKSKKDERLEKHIRSFAERKKNLKMQRAVGISIEGGFRRGSRMWCKQLQSSSLFYRDS